MTSWYHSRCGLRFSQVQSSSYKTWDYSYHIFFNSLLLIEVVYVRTMSRFPPIPENKCSDAQKRVHIAVRDIFSRYPSHIAPKDDEGLILGPYSTLLCVSPEYNALSNLFTI